MDNTDAVLLMCMLTGTTGILLLLLIVGIARWQIRDEGGTIGAIFMEGYLSALLWIAMFVGSVILRWVIDWPSDPTLLLIVIGVVLAIMPWWSFGRIVHWYVCKDGKCD